MNAIVTDYPDANLMEKKTWLTMLLSISKVEERRRADVSKANSSLILC